VVSHLPGRLVYPGALSCEHWFCQNSPERRERTELGYRRFRCRYCQREFNERTGTRFNHLQYPTDIVCLVVLWRVRYKLSMTSSYGTNTSVSSLSSGSRTAGC
jgi:transposase-like protein